MGGIEAKRGCGRAASKRRCGSANRAIRRTLAFARARVQICSMSRVFASTFVAASAVVVALAHCGGSIAETPQPPPGVRFPKAHRAAAEACPSTRPPGIALPVDAGATVDAGISDPNACLWDGDCTKGKNGRCSGTRLGLQCTYDACFVDGDCTSGAACLCSGNGNYCGTGTCLSDATCGGRGCSPTLDFVCGNYGGTRGYYCHTAADTCVDDTDCTEGGAGFCGYDPAASHWSCSYSACAG